MHIPPVMVYVASLWAKIRYGVWIGAMRPIDCLKDNVTPILFMHGAADTFIPHTIVRP